MSISRGTLPPDLIKDLLFLQLPNTPSRTGWVIDRDITKQAISILDIVLPVKIAYQKYKVRTTGSLQRGVHRVRNGVHDIRIADTVEFRNRADEDTTLQVMNRVLWHELAHAMQAERNARNSHPSLPLPKAASYFIAEYRRAKGEHGKSYEANYYEVEANQIALNNQHLLLLKAV